VRKLLYLLAVTITAFGCSYHDGQFVQLSGRTFNREFVDRIVDGRTTERAIHLWFGEAQETRTQTGGRQLLYESIRRRDNVTMIIGIRRRHYQIWKEQLLIHIERGVVKSHQYKSSTVEK